mgnify:CR=1 FL=1
MVRATRILILFVALSLISILGPFIAPYDPFQVSGNPYQQPSWSHILGTDGLGRDIFSQLIVGSRITLTISITAAAISLAIGLFLGLVSSLRGLLSQAVSSLIDSFIVVPPLIIMIFIASIMGPSIVSTIVSISLSYWPQIAKTIRAEALSILERQYVEAARAVGAGIKWIFRKHVIPNMGHVILANLAYAVGIAMVSESIVSFLGLGDQRFFSWGMIFYYAFIQGAIYYGLWLWILSPALVISITAYILFETSRDIIKRA